VRPLANGPAWLFSPLKSPSRSRGVYWIIAFALSVSGSGVELPAQTAGSVASAVSTPVGVPVGRFIFRYGRDHPDLPALTTLDTIRVPLVRQGGAYTVASNRGEVGLVLGEVVPESRFDAAALRLIAETVVSHFNRQGQYGVWVAFEGLEVSSVGLTDLRPAGNRDLSVVVWASQVAEARTLGRGRRMSAAVANNHPRHRWIVERSPLKPPAAPGSPGGLFRRDALERYLRALSAEPSRRVEASIASAGEPGLIVLDYLVSEAKSWQVYSQISNTGTTATNVWRARLGFQHNQLTNHDDVVNFDVLSTPDFGNRAAFVSYKRPILRPGRLIARVYGSFGDFAADGRAFENLRFVGDNWLAGGEVSYRQDLGRSWELGLSGGASYTVYSVATTVSGTSITEGESPFLVPFVNAVVSRGGDAGSVTGGLRVEHSIDSVVNSEPGRGFESLGRTGADPNWTSLRWSFAYQTHLETLFGRVAEENRRAHEVNLRARGRVLLGGGRLIPQEQDLVGGAFSVRGYPESVVSADEMMLFTAEYAFHLPRWLRPGPAGSLWGRPFHWRPPQALRSTDWDLVLRAFVDYARRQVTPETLDGAAPVAGEIPLTERNVDLLGAGVGVEVVVKQYLSLRCDLGTALNSLTDDDRTVVAVGDVRAHVMASFSW